MKEIRHVGKHSYYADVPEIFTYSNNRASHYVEIGKFTSISFGCKIYLNNGDHFYTTGTTYPFPARNFPKTKRGRLPTSKGNVIIGNDVWIGGEVSILSGVTIGDGAVIASHSHVIKDVEPYSIYGGNPARFIKYRFEQELIDKFLEIKWWNYSDSAIDSILPLLQQEPTMEILDRIKLTLATQDLDTARTPSVWHEIQKLHFEMFKHHADAIEMWKLFLSGKSIDQLRSEMKEKL